MNKITELLTEAHFVATQFWFVQALTVTDQTDSTIALRFMITPELFIQIFLSERSQRLSFALIGSAGRVYGRDREQGQWHRHPFEQPDQHEMTTVGMSPQPLVQFFSEVEEIIINNNLL